MNARRVIMRDSFGASSRHEMTSVRAAGTVQPLRWSTTPSASVANPTFDAPTVSANNTFLFTLNVTGCNGQKAAASWR
jgi:hypothetical protein